MAIPDSFIVDPVQTLLDYPIAFGTLGLAGIFGEYPLVGVGVGIIGRFLTHSAWGSSSF